jgi:hypothetical protein
MRTGSTTWYAVGFAAVLAGCSAGPEPEQPVVVAYAPPPVIVPEQPDPAAELDCLAKTVYFEARGEKEKGQRAVAAVVLNRVKSSRFSRHDLPGGAPGRHRVQRLPVLVVV